MADFDKAIKVVLENEGGYVNDPKDSGGETRWGISKRKYPNLDIKNLSKTEAIKIYKRDYWDALKLSDIMADEVALQVFDMAVNSGVRRAALMMQKLFGDKLVLDGIIGEKTLFCINMKQPDVLVQHYKWERVKYYMDLCRRKPVMRKFLYSWIRRCI